jgi:hypothetical protein
MDRISKNSLYIPGCKVDGALVVDDLDADDLLGGAVSVDVEVEIGGRHVAQQTGVRLEALQENGADREEDADQQTVVDVDQHHRQEYDDPHDAIKAGMAPKARQVQHLQKDLAQREHDDRRQHRLQNEV